MPKGNKALVEGASYIGLFYGFDDTIYVFVTDERARCEGAEKVLRRELKEGGASCISASRRKGEPTARPVAE